MDSARSAIRFTAFSAALLLAGCTSTFKFPSWAKSQDKPIPHTNIEQAGAKESAPIQHDALARAEDLYRQEKFAEAEGLFEDIADDTKNRPEVAERARFHQGECLRRQGYYPKAVDCYHRLTQDFPAGLYRTQAVTGMFNISSEWLQPVRDEIDDASKPADKRKGKSWTDSLVLANFDRKLPTFDAEGRAMKALEQAYFADPTGPVADKALFMLGRVNYHREEYRDAARYFQQLVDSHDRSEYRDMALKMAILAKNNSGGGPQYDSRDASDAMRLINTAKATSPALARDSGKMLDEQQSMVRYQQAEKDFETAQFYERTGHPGSAWFYYEIIVRQYPGVNPWHERAKKRQDELRVELDGANMGTWNSSRRMWKQYVLGHETPTMKNPGNTTPALREIPDLKPDVAPLGAGNRAGVPSDIRPR